VLGAREILGLEIDSSWALLTELFTYLVFHEHRHLKAAQIAIGLRPTGTRDLDEKTVRNALTKLRRSVGTEHLPEATSAGYLLEGILCDAVTFQRLSRQAETMGGEDALSLRKEALALVRGAPFADVNDEWIDAERLRSHMTVAIVRCAERLATDLLEAKRPSEAEEAASAGLRGAPRHYVLWELGAWAICDQSDRGRLELWMSDAKANLDGEDFARLERSVATHLGLSE
jgi:two-component SAPR family response regulator